MLQAIIVGALGLLLGFGAAQMNIGDATGKHVTETGKSATNTSDFNTPLAEDFVSTRPAIASMEYQELSAVEIDGLLFMREEEKLARDVYLTLYETWNQPIFSNIARSEQTHTEAVRDLITKYNLTDPVTDDAVGVFVNQELQTLYNTLVDQGNQSFVGALQVGATIEDLDIKDLDEQMALTDNEDIVLVYEQLQRGSRNHLRSFASQLEKNESSYEPQYISEMEYSEIISSDRETGNATNRG